MQKHTFLKKNVTLRVNPAAKAYRMNLFFLEEFSITNSFDWPFFPSRINQAFSLVSASSVSAVVTQISYSFPPQKTEMYQ